MNPGGTVTLRVVRSPPDKAVSWAAADVLPRYLWRYGLVNIDSLQVPKGWNVGDIIAYDWYSTGGQGDINHLQFVTGTLDTPAGREPLIANSSSPGANYGRRRWSTVRLRVEAAHGTTGWSRFALAPKHDAANPHEPRHTPANLYGPDGLFDG